MSYEIVLQALWLILPAYIANAGALLSGRGTPIDFGRNWKDGKRLLGDGKTWRGLATGAVIGMAGGFALSIIAFYAHDSDFAFLGLSNFGRFPLMIFIVGSLCFGALLGDIVESFFKRRRGKRRGEDWVPFDQLDFIIGALVCSFLISSLLQVTGITSTNWFLDTFTLWHVLVLLVITPFFHVFANFVHRKTNHR
ncbi:MAG: CDP-2,3-bis-(O-geranylgeranyl)-sn-glycerol synthase [Candidatus Thermoplasmatota archaeon]|nr:CDP-2,3-bis-(O-geranylgeranyl)-sn-glycerol synthase [Candidatus Thermoplasmatota archaeon]